MHALLLQYVRTYEILVLITSATYTVCSTLVLGGSAVVYSVKSIYDIGLAVPHNNSKPQSHLHVVGTRQCSLIVVSCSTSGL